MEIRDRILAEIDNLNLQLVQMEEQHRLAKVAIGARLSLLARLLPKLTPEVEQIITALGLFLETKS